MRKPVAVPMNQYMGLTLLASKDKQKLVSKLTMEASKAIDSYADVDIIEVTAQPGKDQLDKPEACHTAALLEVTAQL